ncbi:hypothetical protein WJX72_004728 [[Myrmecia] bisecta]|uniref:Uncharacterized protein n=1 Tax=[Myrmecia] bisecta TaxID=41462 RepID=A0AAW1QF04_9CHLO
MLFIVDDLAESGWSDLKPAASRLENFLTAVSNAHPVFTCVSSASYAFANQFTGRADIQSYHSVSTGFSKRIADSVLAQWPPTSPLGPMLNKLRTWCIRLHETSEGARALADLLTDVPITIASTDLIQPLLVVNPTNSKASFKQPESIKAVETALYVPLISNYPHVDCVIRKVVGPWTSKSRRKDPSEVAVTVIGEQITICPSAHRASRGQFMQHGAADQWATTASNFQPDVSDVKYHFRWVVPKSAVNKDQQPVKDHEPSGRKGLSHRESFIYFENIHTKLAFLDAITDMA